MALSDGVCKRACRLKQEITPSIIKGYKQGKSSNMETL